MSGAGAHEASARKASTDSDTGAAPAPVTGTYDFRWPRGSVIRFAFQEGAAPDLITDVKRKLRRTLEAWGVFPDLRKGGPALAYAFVDAAFPPGRPVIAADLAEFDRDASAWIAKLRARGSTDVERLTREHARFMASAPRATISLGDAARLAAYADQALSYDVLIALSPMPIVEQASGKKGSQARLLQYAQSELGSYARRKQLGLPTVYLGRPEYYPLLPDDRAGDEGWFESAEGRFVMAHEVGHILGLVHEHQNPNRQLEWRPAEEISLIVKLRFFEPIYEDFLTRELTRPWQGGEAYSYWRTPHVPNERDLDSVMTEPLYKCLLARRDPDHNCLGERVCAVERAELARMQAPTAADREQLRRIYPPLPFF